ncbi:MAG: pyrimidine 5'-nucleotidase [Alphaproteobacteria bacterium]
MVGSRTSGRDKDLAQVETWLFDLDNTLYPPSAALFQQIERRMGEFIVRALGVATDEARDIQKGLFQDHGSTMTGLMVRYGVDPEDFLAHVHEIDHSVLAPDPALDRALDRLAGRKLVFTNASLGHAERVLGRLGVRRHFEAIFDIREARYLPKPAPEPYNVLVRRHGLEPARTAILDDIAKNLRPAAALGMTTVWVRTDSPYGREDSDGDHVHYVTDDLVPWLAEVALGAVR